MITGNKNNIEPSTLLRDCDLCPRECHADRLNGEEGYCRSTAGFNIASICIHRGEEPVISGENGICNIFFTHCNLRCTYCQNFQISDNDSDQSGSEMNLEEAVDRIIGVLRKGINRVGFVSPSHNIPQLLQLVREVQTRGFRPVWVYNSNGYDKVETLMMLEGIIDVYLPDLKYMDASLGNSFSDVPDYPEVAAKALKEMFRQKGSTLILDEKGGAESGMVVRHLVLPGHVQNSINVLSFLAEELSPRIHISLMAQYYPTPRVRNHPHLARRITQAEYQEVVGIMESLGMYNGWVQEFDSSDFYQPDFNRDHPFET